MNLVSILIPTHNRPIFCELALKSALSQTWSNIEIIISDNSDNELTREIIEPYVKINSFVKYLRVPGYTAIKNFHNCFHHASGDFINYLMDDDLFHPRKIELMMHMMLSNQNVGLVTSRRHFIDSDGKSLGEAPDIFQTDTYIKGHSLGAYLAGGAPNIVGEPTMVLYRRSANNQNFGMYMNYQYIVPSDVASWLSVLTTHDAIYLHEPLSFIRLHPDQDQRNQCTKIQGHFESLHLLCTIWEHGYFLSRSSDDYTRLGKIITQTTTLITELRNDVCNGDFQVGKIPLLIQRATNLLLGSPN